jgi:hypothetical protein
MPTKPKCRAPSTAGPEGNGDPTEPRTGLPGASALAPPPPQIDRPAGGAGGGAPGMPMTLNGRPSRKRSPVVRPRRAAVRSCSTRAPTHSEPTRLGWVRSYAPAAKACLGHPLLLLLLGALLTGFLFPAFTRRWQDYQRETQIKEALVGAISEATGPALAWTGLPWHDCRTRSGVTADACDEIPWDWRIASAKVDAELRAYFGSESDIVADWQAYSGLVSATLELPKASNAKASGRENEGQVLTQLEALLASIEALDGNPQLQMEIVAVKLENEDQQDVGKLWAPLHAEMAQLKDAFIERALSGDVAGF